MRVSSPPRSPSRGLPWALAASGLVAALLAGCGAPAEPSPRTTTTATTAEQGTASESTTPAPSSTTTSPPLPQVFDHAAVQDAVYKLLTETYGLEDVGVVICPPDQPVEADSKFRCTARIDGDEKKVIITVTSDKGDYTVSYPE